MKFEKEEEEEETEKGDFEKKIRATKSNQDFEATKNTKQFKCDAIPVECEKHD